MSTSSETLRALYGTWRLARGDEQGLGFFNFSIEGFWRSFLAAAIVFPAFVLLRWNDIFDAPEDFPAIRYMLVESIAYVIKWVAFPLIMFHVIPMLGRAERYIAFITVYNWASVLQMGLYLAALMLGVLFPSLGAGGFCLYRGDPDTGLWRLYRQAYPVSPDPDRQHHCSCRFPAVAGDHIHRYPSGRRAAILGQLKNKTASGRNTR